MIAADNETDRIHAAHPGLKDKVSTLKYRVIFDASARGGWFWTNRGKTYSAEYEIATTSDGAQKLKLEVNYWSVEGKYLTGAIGEDWITIKAAYRDSKAHFKSDSYGDPGISWEEVDHGNLKAIFRQVASDAGLLMDNTDEDSVLAPIVKAFLADKLYERKLYYPERTSLSPLEVILKEMQFRRDI